MSVFTINKTTGVGGYRADGETDKSGWQVDPSTGRKTQKTTDGAFTNTYVATAAEEAAYQAQSKNGSNSSFYNSDNTTDYASAPASTSSIPTGTSSTSGMISSQADQALASRVAALAKARDTAIGGYTAQQEALPGQYQPLRDQASFQGAKGVNTINEQTAGTGQFNSGANVTAQTTNATNTASNVNGLNVQQQDEVNKLQQAITQAQANYGYDLASATGDVNSQKMAALIAQANSDRGFGLQEKQIDNQSSQFDKTFAQNDAHFAVTSNLQQQQINNSAAQAAASIGLGQAQLAANIAQNGADNIYRDATLAQAASQFATTTGLTKDNAVTALTQWAAIYNSGLDQAAVTNGINAAAQLGYPYAPLSSGSPQAIVIDGKLGWLTVNGVTYGAKPV